jgi:hypothetical protein
LKPNHSLNHWPKGQISEIDQARGVLALASSASQEPFLPYVVRTIIEIRSIEATEFRDVRSFCIETIALKKRQAGTRN